MDSKICESCEQDKPIEDFYLNGNGGKRRKICKKCKNRRRWPGSDPREQRPVEGNKTRCSNCRKFKTYRSFNRRTGNRTGLHSWCKLCMRKAAKKPRAIEKKREWYERNKERAARSNKDWANKNPLRMAWLNLRQRACASEIVFTLTYDDFLVLMSTADCPICGITMLEKGTHGRYAGDMKSVDRIQPGGDYCPENCACVCLRCNQVKNDGTFQEHLAIAYWMIKQQRGRHVQ